METTPTANVIEVHKIAAKRKASSGPVLLNLDSTSPSLADAVTEDGYIVKVYNEHAQNMAGGVIPSDAALIPAGSVHLTSDSILGSPSVIKSGLSGTKTIVKIMKPQISRMTASENSPNVDTVYTDTAGDTENFIAVPFVEDDQNKIGSHSVQVEKLRQATDSRQLVTHVTEDVMNENSSEKKSPVIMFKWGSVKKPFRCHICDMSFTDGNLLRAHLEKHNISRKEPSKPFPCSLCMKSFQTNRSLERHQQVHSGQTQKKCKYCYKIFANKENLDKHVQMHNGNKAYTCLFCSEQFTSRPSLEKHMASHKVTKKFKCNICDKTFNRKDTLERHLLTHDIGKRNKHECVECKKSFSYLFALKRHVRSVHGGEPDGKTCEVCGKFIKNRENIARHMQLHEGKRPFDCQECGRKFTQKQHLVDHMVTHSNSFPFECKFCCAAFRFRRSLGRHLKKHYTVHADIKKLECTECRLMFSSEKEIVRHLESTHYNFKECLVCKEIFTDEKSCVKHMLKIHDLPVAVIYKKMNLVNKSTETEPAGPDCNVDFAGPDCNVDFAGPDCNVDFAGQDCNADSVDQGCNSNPTGLEGSTGIATAETGMDMDAEDGVDKEIEKVSNEFDHLNKRNEDGRNEEIIQSEIDETVTDSQQVIYILFDDGKEVCALQKMDVEEVVSQSVLTGPEYTQVQVQDIPHGEQIILTSETNEQYLEAVVDDNSKTDPITEATGGDEEENRNSKIAESYPDTYQADELASTSEKEVQYTYSVVMPDEEAQDGSKALEESKFVADRSKLLQSLIDYAEQIKEAELSMSTTEAPSNSETKI